MCFADPKESATGSQVIRRYTPVMATLKFTYYLNERIYDLLKTIYGNYLVGDRLISYKGV